MDDFFHAFGEINVEDPYLRIGNKEYYQPSGNLLPNEVEAVEEFSWLDWTEDPSWYREWAKRWQKDYACNSEINAKNAMKLVRGELSPKDAAEVESIG